MEKQINKSAEQFWLRRFSEEPDLYHFPWTEAGSGERYQMGLSLPYGASEEIMRICHHSTKALQAYFAAALSLTLYRYVQRKEQVICTAIEAEILPLKIALAPYDTYRQLLDQVKQLIAEAGRYSDYSFDEFLRKWEQRKGKPATSLFHKVLLTPADAGIHPDVANDFGLVIRFFFDDKQLGLDVQFTAAAGLKEIAIGFLDSYLLMLQNVKLNIHEPLDAIDMLSAALRSRLLNDLGGRTVNGGLATTGGEEVFGSLFGKVVLAYPHRRAVVGRDGQLSYRVLERRARAIARALIRQGVAPGDRVAMVADRSVEMITGLLGILLSGGAFVPIDPEYPADRIFHILSDSQARCMLSSRRYAFLFEEKAAVLVLEDIGTCDAAKEEVLPLVKASDLAYVIYTSGTTGVPNGVMIEQGSLVGLCHWHNRYYGLTDRDISTKYAGFGFDATVWEIFPVLLSGGCLYIIEEEYRYDLKGLQGQYERHGVTISFLPTPLGEQFMQQGRGPLSLRKLLVGGDRLKAVGQHIGYELYNNYGPTENTVVATACRISSHERTIPIGRPVGTTRAYILLPGGLQLQPLGVAGELCLSGSSLARGYLGKAELTAQKFVADPFCAGGRMYRTGDLARWLPDGNIEYLGRIDSQVKVRGYRIELGEIESCLVKHPCIDDVVVVKKEDANGNGYLCAYMTGKETVDTNELTAFLEKRLPAYMVPSLFVPLTAIPCNANGKADRAYLAGRHEEAQSASGASPESEEEQAIAGIWQTVLGRARIGIDDNFFTLGGDSIKAIQIQSRLRTLGYLVKTRNIFSLPTIRGLAGTIVRQQQDAEQGVVTGRVPLTPIQAGFFNNSHLSNKAHFNQALMLEFSEVLAPSAVCDIFRALQWHHDALRTTFRREEGKFIQEIRPGEPVVDLEVHTLYGGDGQKHEDASAAEKTTFIADTCNRVQASIDLEEGPLMKLLLFQEKETSRLVVILHHLVVDGVSWRILLEDIHTLYRRIILSENVDLPPKSDSFRRYAEKIAAYASSEVLKREKVYWGKVEDEPVDPIAAPLEEPPAGTNFIRDSVVIDFGLDENSTGLLLTAANQAYGTEASHLLLAALAMSIHRAFGSKKFLLWLEGHGREEIAADIDLSRTVGWFTTVYPFLVAISDYTNRAAILVEIKDAYQRIPNKGIGYGVLKQLCGNRNACTHQPQMEVLFNYLGQFDTNTGKQPFTIINKGLGAAIDPDNQRDSGIDITCLVADQCLQVSVSYNPGRIDAQKMNAWMEEFRSAIMLVVDHCIKIEKRVFTPGDFTYKLLPFGVVAGLTAQYPVQDIFTLSPLQEGMLFHNLADRRSSIYFEQISYEVSGHFNKETLKEALGCLVRRHAILRTLFFFNNISRPVQVVLTDREPEFYWFDLCGENPGEIRDFFETYKMQDRLRGFDVTTDTLFRLCVMKTDREAYRFIWSYHHILMDGWCVGIIHGEFYALYRQLTEGRKPQLPVTPSYREYIKWLELRDMAASRQYWKEYLRNWERFTPVGTTTEAGTAYEQAHEVLTIPADVTERLNQLSAMAQVTVSTILQAAWAILLGRLTNADDVLFGKVVSGRPPELKGGEQMIGLFINTVPLRIKLNSRASFLGLVQEVQEQSIAGEPHHFFSLAAIQKGSPAGARLFDHLFAFENYPAGNLPAGQWHSDDAVETGWKDLEVFERTNYDFNMIAVPGAEIKITFKYNRNAFESSYITVLKDALLLILEQACTYPQRQIGEMEIVPAETRQYLLHQGEGEMSGGGEEVFGSLFGKVVLAYPHRRAVVGRDGQLSYRVLEGRARSIARALIRQGVAPGDRVAMVADRSVEMITGLLGILLSGGAFVPIDPEYPADRIFHILSDSQARCMLSSRRYAFLFEEKAAVLVLEDIGTCDAAKEEVLPLVKASDLAYVIYTSGTTGVPNGVMIEQGSLVGLCHWHNRYYGLTDRDISTKYAGFGFDATVWEIFPVLLSGGCLYIIEEEYRYDLKGLQGQYERHGVTISFLPTPLGEQFMQQGRGPLSLRKLLVGGDRLKAVGQHIGYELYNNYGPTENTVVATACRISSHERTIPIGRPVGTTRAYILLPGGLQLQPLGVVGELCLSGSSLARGYLGKAELTAQKFVADPFCAGGRMYRTGDLARWLPDGNIEYLGRIDSQVKVRGYRIELGEIESCLVKHQQVQEAAVLVKENKNGYGQLYAFYVSDGMPGQEEELRLYVSARLPAYMVPAHFIRLNTLPVNSNGKTDKHRLLLEAEAHAALPVFHEPVTATQNIVLAAWEKVLGAGRVTLTDNFFDLGGTSLDLIRVNNELSGHFPISNLIMQLFNYPTVRSLASFLEGGNKQEITPSPESHKTKKDINDSRQRQREKRSAKKNIL